MKKNSIKRSFFNFFLIIQNITDNRTSQRKEMDSYLMRSSCFNSYREQSKINKSLYYFVFCYRYPSPFMIRRKGGKSPGFSSRNRKINHSFVLGNFSINKGNIFFSCFSFFKLFNEIFKRRFVFGNHQKTRDPFVQTMNYSRSRRIRTNLFYLRIF